MFPKLLSEEQLDDYSNTINELSEISSSLGKDVYYTMMPHKTNVLKHLYPKYIDNTGNIDINKNKYIDKYFSYGNRYLKLRINLYDFNYNIATICDKLLGYVQQRKLNDLCNKNTQLWVKYIVKYFLLIILPCCAFNLSDVAVYSKKIIQFKEN